MSFCQLPPVQLGDVATWVGALGTTGAFTVSLLLLRQAVQDRRVAQAKHVAAWQVEICVQPPKP